MKKLLFILSGILLLSCNRVTELPEVITSNAIVTDSGIFLTAEVSFTGGDRNTTRGFCWSESPNPTILNADFLDDGKGLGVYSTMIDGLEEYTTYYVRSFADNKAGKAYGNELSFTTGSFNYGNAFFNTGGCLECDNYGIGETFSLNGNLYIVAGNGDANNILANPSSYCLSHVTDLSRKSGANWNLSEISFVTTWDVSNVTEMNYLFSGLSSFNEDIGNWDVSNVIEMYGLFEDASSFNQDIGNWDMSSIQSMQSLFKGASSFNQDISGWDISGPSQSASGYNFYELFRDATAFNQDISSWDVSNVTIMERMFQGASSFNQDIGNWDVSNVYGFNHMFQDASLFNQDLSQWCVSNISVISDFATNSSLIPSYYPVWGTCP